MSVMLGWDALGTLCTTRNYWDKRCSEKWLRYTPSPWTWKRVTIVIDDTWMTDSLNYSRPMLVRIMPRHASKMFTVSCSKEDKDMAYCYSFTF
jgi:hypothetical protein